MRAKRLLTALLTLFVLVGVSCTGNEIDDADAADVVLEVFSFQNPSVTAQIDAGGGGGCQLIVTRWTASLSAEPINELAGSPFNDVQMNTVDIVYSWDNPLLTVPNRTFGLGGITVTAGSIRAISFFPIALADLTAAFEGEAASLNLAFHGRTVEGSSVNLTVVQQLQVDNCI